jgi:hypothetical protein
MDAEILFRDRIEDLKIEAGSDIMKVTEAIENKLKKTPGYLMMTIEVRRSMVEKMAKIVLMDSKDSFLIIDK